MSKAMKTFQWALRLYKTFGFRAFLTSKVTCSATIADQDEAAVSSRCKYGPSQ